MVLLKDRFDLNFVLVVCRNIFCVKHGSVVVEDSHFLPEGLHALSDL